MTILEQITALLKLHGVYERFDRIDVALNDQRQIDDQNRQKNDAKNRTDNSQHLLLIVCCLVCVCLAHKESPLLNTQWVHTAKQILPHLCINLQTTL